MKIHRKNTINRIRAKWVAQKDYIIGPCSLDPLPEEIKMTPQDWDDIIAVLSAQQELIFKQAKNLSNVRKGNRELVTANRSLKIQLQNLKKQKS